VLRGPMRIGLWHIAPLVLTLACCCCREPSAPPGPEADCRRACERKAHGCSEHECARGCAFVLDRLVEHECASVLECVASHAAATGHDVCSDPVWADCAAAVGVHADGGPPAPAPPAE
jgi:hypothetical protein